MFQKILAHARDVFFLCAAICLLVIAGLVLRLYWFEEPIQALGKRLLAKDGALLVSILSNERTIRSIRALSAPRPKQPQRKSAAEYLIDTLAAKDGILLRKLSSHLLQETTVKTSIKTLLTPRPKAKPQTGPAPPRPSPVIALGRYAIDQLVARDGKALRAISKQWMDWIQAQQRALAKRRKARKQAFKQGAQTLNQTIESLGRYAIDRLMQKQGALALRLTQELAKPATNKPTTKGKPRKAGPKAAFALKPLLTDLGKHAIDRLTLSGARPLRTILQDLLGPEPMRVMRSLRHITQNLSAQIRKQPLSQLVKDAAYQLGRGGLETFLLQQQARQRQQTLMRSTIVKMGRRLYSKLRQAHPCFVPAGRRWLSYDKRQITARLYYLAGRQAQCTPARCRHHRKALNQHIERALRPLQKQIDLIELTLQPSCASLTQRSTKPPSAKSPTAKRPKTKRPTKRRSPSQPPTRRPLMRKGTTPTKRSIPTKRAPSIRRPTPPTRRSP